MTIKSTKKYHNHLTRIATFCALLYSNSALCAELVEYDHTFLMGKDASNIDLSRYTEGNPTLPGIYDVSVYVNDQPIMSQSIAFTVIEGKKERSGLHYAEKIYCNFISVHQTRIAKKPFLLKRDEDLGDCLNLAEMIPQSSIRYDVNDQRTGYRRPPSAWIMKNYQNYVDPSLWENGINAAMLSYNLNGYHSESPVQNK